MTPTKDYFVRVRNGLDDLQKGNIGILFNADFNSWSYVRKVFNRVAGSPNALRFAVKMVDNIFQDLEKIWNSLIEEQGQFVNNEQEKSVEIDFVSWSKRIFAETTMIQTARQHPNVLSAYYNRITNRDLDNIQSINEEFLDRLFIATDCVQHYLTIPPFIRNLPIINTYSNYLYENLMWTRHYAYNLVKDRRKEIENIEDKEKLSPDMLNMLLTANTPNDIIQSISNESNKKPMSDEEVGDIIVEIFSEGIDAFILYNVGNNPDVEQRILDEIEKVFDYRTDFKISYEDLNKLVYVEAVIKEVLRIRPVTSTISRFLKHSDKVDEYNIPSSTQLAINIVSLHKNQNYWKEPTKFSPSRFLASSNNDETYNKSTLMNFGGGIL
ncbi:8838_t:CDS:2 [Funneliformis geosporum]|uniref:8838_t:CDS:1 n=1 Tax=Funneliformis geosporum TaxID=1117311 RepID=A0A9W4WUJ9_9GLOM|nr:8838_t:CDS:2 [Funneliformis geosporum]